MNHSSNPISQGHRLTSVPQRWGTCVSARYERSSGGTVYEMGPDPTADQFTVSSFKAEPDIKKKLLSLWQQQEPGFNVVEQRQWASMPEWIANAETITMETPKSDKAEREPQVWLGSEQGWLA